MKKLVILLIAGALVSPAFAEPGYANSTESGANAPAIAAAQDALTAQPAASSAFAQAPGGAGSAQPSSNGTDNSNKIMKKNEKKQQPEDEFYKLSFLMALPVL